MPGGGLDRSCMERSWRKGGKEEGEGTERMPGGSLDRSCMWSAAGGKVIGEEVDRVSGGGLERERRPGCGPREKGRGREEAAVGSRGWKPAGG